MNEIAETFRADLLAGKHAIVVGATSGIGLDIARGLALVGARVTGTGSSAGKIARLDEPGIDFVRLDVRDRLAVQEFCAAQSRVDILVNAAGVARGGEEWEEDVFLDTIEVNLNAQMRFAFLLHDRLAETRGAVVNIASMLSFLADPGVPAYCASKTGILGLTRSCAHAWGREGIRVNAIAPGYHRTEMTKPIWSRPEGETAIAKRTALGHWGTTQDLVGAVLFLCSPAASYITGICLEVDGGFATGNPLE